MMRVSDIRQQLIEKYINEDFVIDKTSVKTIELIGATFIADEDWIIRKPNYDYIESELAWYKSQSLCVNDIPGETPQLWKNVSDKNGMINSNYGWCIWSEENGSQYDHVINELRSNPNSRRATMIYNRPSMHTDFNIDGKSDFICTYANTFYIRDGKLYSHYLMRSNDAVFGYDNDFAWCRYVQECLASDLKLELGDIIWTTSNLHVYERHFKFIQELI